MHSTCITMHLSIVFLALLALTAAIPTSPTLHAADQDLLRKQQDVIHLLENIVGDISDQHLHEIGVSYEHEANLQNYENPSVVMYYVGLVRRGHAQPKGTPFSYSISTLRKELSLLTQILLGAKDYQTYLNTAAWARVYVNEDQFVKAFVASSLQRHDMHGIIFPAPYEVYPHYFFDSRIIQKVYDYVYQHTSETQVSAEPGHGVHHIHVNYTSNLPYGENQIAYFTEDIGLNSYYLFVDFASHMFPTGPQTVQKYGHGGFQQGSDETQYSSIGHGSHFYYVHQQLLARYNLERLAQGLSPIKELDNYYEHIETPFISHLRFLNGVNLPERNEHIYITPRHHNYELLRLVRKLEQRIIEAIDFGHVLTAQGTFLSLYQPQGLNILGELIEGTGRSINPRYYGSFQYVARSLLGNVPEFNNIWEYTPSALELGATAVRDPIFYQLFAKILEFFHYYQQGLPAYQYNDIVVPGVNIEKVEVGDLITYFSDSEVDLNNAVPHSIGQGCKSFNTVRAHLKRLDHKQYEYTIHVQSQKAVPGSVVRVFVGPKYNYDGQHIDINEHRHYFFELDQFVFDLTEGHNVIVRNSHQATGQSYDWPSVKQIKERVEGAIRSQNPYYVIEPQQLFGFPARLSLPKGSTNGYPLQFFVIVSSGIQHQPEHYGPVVEEEWMSYDPHHYQIVGTEEYQQYSRHPVDSVHGGSQTIDVIPEFEGQIITEGNWHWGYLYKKYPGSYFYPHWQQTYYSIHSGEDSNVHHEDESPEKRVFWRPHVGSHGVASHSVSHGTGHGVGHGISDSVSHGAGVHSDQIQSGYRQMASYPGYVFRHQNVEGQGMEHLQGHEAEYWGSAHHPSGNGYFGTYPSGTYQGWRGHEEHLHHYYQGKDIIDIIGGVVSLDGRPLGYPFDRPLADSAFYAPNIYVKDVFVYHNDDYIPYEQH